MNTKAQIDNLIERLWHLSRKYADLEKVPVHYNDEIILPPGEIHSVQVIGENKGINIKELGEHFGISKSAASQMVSRLVKKGYAEKSNPSGNNKELCISLTELGWKAFHLHEDLHNHHHEKLIAKLKARFSDDELKNSEEFLQVVEEVIDERMNSLPFAR